MRLRQTHIIPIALKDEIHVARFDTLRLRQRASRGKLRQAQLESLIPSLHSPNSVGHPLGWMAEADWHATIDTLRSYMGLTSDAPITDYYTNEFLPAQQ